jgi:hypothetical protein
MFGSSPDKEAGVRKERDEGLGLAWRISRLAGVLFDWVIYGLTWLIVLVVPLIVVFGIAATLWDLWFDNWMAGLAATLIVVGAGAVALRWLARP